MAHRDLRMDERSQDDQVSECYENSDQLKRYRTNYSKNQIGRLEQEFRREKYLSRLKRTELAKELGLKESTIKVWFQNRRMKEKRQLTTINIPQILANSDPFLYSYLLDSARAYYSLTSQFGQSPYQSTIKMGSIPTETALAALMSTNKSLQHPMFPPLHNGHTILKPMCPQELHNFRPVMMTSTVRTMIPNHEPSLAHSHTYPTQQNTISTNKSAITFRPYMDQ